MESLTIEERQDMILQLAGRDISVIANVKFNGGISIAKIKRLMVHGNTFITNEIESPSVEVAGEDSDFNIPTDTVKYDIIKTDQGTYWKLKD